MVSISHSLKNTKSRGLRFAYFLFMYNCSVFLVHDTVYIFGADKNPNVKYQIKSVIFTGI